MFKKTLKVSAIAVLTMAAITPIAVKNVEAASVKITDVVVEKEGKFYKIEISTYYNLKSVGHSLLNQIELKHVHSSEGNVYPVKIYQNAQAVGGNMAGAFETLDGKDLEVDIAIGNIEFPPNAPPTIIEPEEVSPDIFEVRSIE